jgi:adenosylcobinamide-GDP ribazoletransferase
MNILETIAVAFSMFSAVPMPQFQWEEKNMKYSLCAFPFIGLVIGIIILIWIELAQFFGISKVFFSAVFTVIPVVITGGIHLDGFCDTWDAISSHASRDKKLEILSDSNSGAFAIIYTVCYMIIYFGAVYEINFERGIYISLCIGFMVSRSLSALAVSSFKCAKNSGLIHMFSDMAAKKKVRAIIIFYLAVMFFMLIIFGNTAGLGVIIISLIMFAVYYRVSMKQFGGITGDLAGWFLQLCEIGIILSFVVTEKI